MPGLSFAVGRDEDGWRLAAHLHVPVRRVPLSGGGVLAPAFVAHPFLSESAADWHIDQAFLDRAALVAWPRRRPAWSPT